MTRHLLILIAFIELTLLVAAIGLVDDEEVLIIKESDVLAVIG